MLKLPYSEILGKECFPFIHNSNKPYIDCVLRRAIVSKKRETATFKMGNTWYKAELDPVFDEYGNVAGGVHILHDITEDLKLREELNKSKERFESIFQNAADSIMYLDMNGIVLEANRAYYRLTKEKPAAVIGRDIKEVTKRHYTDSEYRKMLNFIDSVLNGDRIKTLTIQTKFGSVLEIKILPINRNSKGITAITHDVTDQARMLEALAESEKEYRELSSNARDIIFTLIPDLTISRLNPAFEQITGFIAADWLGKPFEDIVHPQDKKKISAILKKNMQGEHTDIFEFRFQTVEKAYKYGECIFAPVKKGKKTTHIIGYLRDITKIKELELEFQHTQRLESIGKLAGGIAHDFNNLLTAINGFSELGLMTVDKDNPAYELLKNINDTGQSAAEIIKKLLAFGRKQTIALKPCHVNDVLKNMEKMLKRLIGEDIALDLKLTDGIENILADKSQLEQIFTNLIVNARDAIETAKRPTSERKITIETDRLTVGAEFSNKHIGVSSGEYVLITISDNGIGMSRETVDKIFEPFFTTKERGKGTGMGLATVYGIIKQNEGSIHAYSEPNIGTTFKIYWPVAEITEEVLEEKPKKHISETAAHGENIFVVEDEESVRNFAQNALTSLGYTVLTACDGKEALKVLQKHSKSVDVLLTDVIMPNMNGEELAKQVSKKYPEIKILFASGYTSEHIAIKGVLKDNVNFISKPYTYTQLATKIREVLEG